MSVRRTEMVVERTVCTLDLHGTVALTPGDLCPMCGQAVPSTALKESDRELAETEI